MTSIHCTLPLAGIFSQLDRALALINTLANSPAIFLCTDKLTDFHLFSTCKPDRIPMRIWELVLFFYHSYHQTVLLVRQYLIKYHFTPLLSFAAAKDCIPNPIHAVDILVLTPQHTNAAATAVCAVKAVVSMVTWKEPIPLLAATPWSRPRTTENWKDPSNQWNVSVVWTHSTIIT